MRHEDQRDGTALAWAAIRRAFGLSLVVLVGWVGYSPAGGSARNAATLVAALALAALAGVAWYLRRARSEGRWRAALDRYADQQQGPRTPTRGMATAARATNTVIRVRSAEFRGPVSTPRS